MNQTELDHINAIIDDRYPEGSALGDVYRLHCGKVADLAVEIARACHLSLDEDEIRAAAMLHDFGISECHAPSICCHGEAPYICHGYLGADSLRRLGVDEKFARVAERHTGTGLPPEEIASEGLPLPADRCYMPETLLERLICYADKFYSKSGDGDRKEIAKVREQMARFDDDSLRRFDALTALFSPKDCNK